MSNFLNEDYVFWLNRYKEKTVNPTVRLIAGELITLLPKAKSIEDVIFLLKKYTSTSEDRALYGPINFFAQLSTWQTELDNILNNCSMALLLLEDNNTNQNIAPLIRFLHELLTSPKLRMHNRMPGLLAILDKELPNILHFLANLEKVPLPILSQPGSFNAIIPCSTDHAACILLLNNLSHKFDEHNILWTRSNTLLQNALLIYQDKQLKEISLEDEKQAQEKHEELNICTLI